MLVLPVFMTSTGAASASSTTTATVSQTTGRRMMLWASRSNRPDRPAARFMARRPKTGTRRAFDAVAEQAEQGGQQDQRGEQRGEDDQHDAHAHADGDVERHDDHAEHGQHDGHAAEEDGAVGGGAGGGDGVDLGQAAGAFLAVAADHEQRVVDAHGQAHHREDVEHEGVHGVDLADERR